MESRTLQFIEALRKGRLLPLDIDVEIETLTQGYKDHKLRFLMEVILDDLRERIAPPSLDDNFDEFLDSQDDIMEIRKAVQEDSSERGVILLWQLRNDLRSHALMRIREKLRVTKQSIRVVPDAVDDCVRVVQGYIDESRVNELKVLLKGHVVPHIPIDFNGTWKSLASSFGLLKKKNLLIVQSYDELQKWLQKSFKATGKAVKDSSFLEYLKRTEDEKASIFKVSKTKDGQERVERR